MRPELKMMADGVIEAVKGYVRQVHDGFTARLDTMEKRLAELPAPKDGEPGPAGPPGKDAPAVDEAAVAERVLAAIPRPADGKDGAPGVDGKSVTAEDVQPLVAAEVAKAVAALPPPAPGRDGRDGLPGVQGEKGLDGRNGADGIHGKDGLGFDDLTVEHDGERTFTVKFQQGDRVKSFPFVLPIVIDRGVFREGSEYVKGDGTTWAGSFFIAQKDAPAGKPGESDDWRLAVKRGRDGKDGAPGERGEKGERGMPGKDGVRHS